MSAKYERIKQLRLKNNYLQKQVAVACKVAPVRISQWEKGVKNPSVENLWKLADLYQTSIDYIVGRSDEYNGREVVQIVRSEELSPTEKAVIEMLRAYDAEKLNAFCLLYGINTEEKKKSI